MEVLNGYKIDNFQIAQLQKIGDLDYFEGPSLSLFKSVKDDTLYLFDWVDCDAHAHRWLVYAVSIQQLTKFIDRKITRYDLVFNQKQVEILDLVDNSTLSQAYSLKTSDLPQSYKPNTNTFFDSNESPKTDLENIHKMLNMLMSSTSYISKKAISPEILRGLPKPQIPMR
jgi:hypothetical protein